MSNMNIPGNYAVCIAGGSCPLAEQCLRALAYKQLAQSPKQSVSISIVNPNNDEIRYATEQCKQFRSSQPKRYAKGMTHLYDHITQHQIKAVRLQVEHCFSSRRVYYYSRSGEMLISPRIQKAIAEIFRKNGIEEAPQFDDYVMDYDWHN